MQAMRPAAEGEAQEQAVRAEADEVKREVAKAHEEEEAVPEEKDVAVVGEEAEAETETEGEAEAEVEAEVEVEVEAEAGASSAKKNRIQVSTNKKPLYFYVNLAKVCTPAVPPLFATQLFHDRYVNIVGCRGTCRTTTRLSSPLWGWVISYSSITYPYYSCPAS
jgi:hypothetical protein